MLGVPDSFRAVVRGLAHLAGQQQPDLRLLGGHGGADGQPDGGQGLGDDLDLSHGMFFFNEVEPALNIDEPSRSRPLFAFHLGAADVEHFCNPAGVDTGVENGGDVLQAETELAEGNNPVQPFQLRGVVGAAPACRSR